MTGVQTCALPIFLDLFVAHQGLNPTAPRELYALRSPVLDVVRVADRSRLYVFDYTLPGRSRRYLGHDDGFRLAEGPPVPWRVAAAARTYLHPFTLGSLGLEGSYVADTIMLYPPYLEYEKNAAPRVIPVVVLERVLHLRQAAVGGEDYEIKMLREQDFLNCLVLHVWVEDGFQ